MVLISNLPVNQERLEQSGRNESNVELSHRSALVFEVNRHANEASGRMVKDAD
ncbi:hypothetical protein J6TS7_06770 [Paenibacillus dendritiformis]|nr:hypothetical protein J6TS7_06770 [Paenibacillus dendritiformis]